MTQINTQIVPAFYALLQNQDLSLQPRLVENLQASITAIVAAAHQDVSIGRNLAENYC